MDEVGVEEAAPTDRFGLRDLGARGFDNAGPQLLGVEDDAGGFGNAVPRLLDMEDATRGFDNAAPRLLDMEGEAARHSGTDPSCFAAGAAAVEVALDDIEGATDDDSRGFGNAVPPLLDMEVGMDEDVDAPDEASHPLAVHASDPFG